MSEQTPPADDVRELLAEARQWPRDGVNEGALINALADALEVRLRGTVTEPNEAEDAARVRRINDLRQARDAVSGALAHRMHQTDPEMFFLAVRQMLNSTRYLVDGYAPDAEARS